MTRTPMIEALESREFLSASPVRDFLSTAGYSAAGSWWDYDVNYSLNSNITSPQSGSGSTHIAVSRSGKHPTRYSPLKIQTTGSGSNITLYLQKTSTGTSVIQLEGKVGAGTMTLKMTNLQFAPATVVDGTTYTSNGNFTGTFTASMNGASATGDVSGRAAASATILGVRGVTVPSGTYQAVKGVYTISVNGTIHLTAQGQSVTAQFKESISETFYSVKRVGIVKVDASQSVNLTAEGESVWLTGTTSGALTGYNLAAGT